MFIYFTRFKIIFIKLIKQNKTQINIINTKSDTHVSNNLYHVCAIECFHIILNNNIIPKS